MEVQRYSVNVLPLFVSELTAVTTYISDVLLNPKAANRLADMVEQAIKTRAEMPCSFEQVHSKRQRDVTYYRIYVGNYIVYYTVTGNVMEVKRFLYGSRDIGNLIN